MLNIEVIKFEAQDVITTSVAAPHTHDLKSMVIETNGKYYQQCKECDAWVEIKKS